MATSAAASTGLASPATAASQQTTQPPSANTTPRWSRQTNFYRWLCGLRASDFEELEEFAHNYSDGPMTVEYWHSGGLVHVIQPENKRSRKNNYMAQHIFRASTFAEIKAMAGSRSSLHSLVAQFEGPNQKAELRVGHPNGSPRSRLQLTGEWPYEIDHPFFLLLLEQILRNRKFRKFWSCVAAALILWAAVIITQVFRSDIFGTSTGVLTTPEWIFGVCSLIALILGFVFLVAAFVLTRTSVLMNPTKFMLRVRRLKTRALALSPEKFRQFYAAYPDRTIAIGILIGTILIVLLTVLLLFKGG
jgi:hypothetical protein